MPRGSLSLRGRVVIFNPFSGFSHPRQVIEACHIPLLPASYSNRIDILVLYSQRGGVAKPLPDTQASTLSPSHRQKIIGWPATKVGGQPRPHTQSDVIRKSSRFKRPCRDAALFPTVTRRWNAGLLSRSLRDLVPI